MTQTHLPRLVVGGLAGDSGKSLVSMGLVGAFRARDLVVAPFKKGPDYIDAAWLGIAAGRPGRNLDTFLMSKDAIYRSLAQVAPTADIAVVEGNRGLFDGFDALGSHSTAELAKMVEAPVVLVVDTTKVTRTLAAMVLGCRLLDPEVALAGVILNRVGTSRQERLVREAIIKETGLPVLGAIPRLTEQLLPSRHLGLVTASEHPRRQETVEQIAEVVAQHVDVDEMISIALSSSDCLSPSAPARDLRREVPGARPKIGVLRDQAFSFYYPENLTALEEAGAELVPISPLNDREFPDVAAIYAGGGFPEEHARTLAKNEPLRMALRSRIADGLPVWAECGGLIYLAQALIDGGERYPMVGALPIVVERNAKPQGHGYVTAQVDADNPFLPKGTALTGHEFHYTRLQPESAPVETMLGLSRGTGIGEGRDGIRVANVVATYTHIHALGVPEWAPGVVQAAAGAPR